MVVLFVTGLIGSGKSFAGEYLGQRGAARIDLDDLSRRAVEVYPDCLESLLNTFGSDILDDGVLNRKLLAARAFVDLESQKALESCVLPYIKAQLRNMLSVDGCAVAKPQVCVVEVPLVDRLEEFYDTADEILYISVPYELRKERAVLRGMEVHDFEARSSLQPSEQYLEAVCTYTIKNLSQKDDFKRSLDKFWEYLKEHYEL